MSSEKRKKKKKKWPKIVGIAILLFILAGGAFAYNVWNVLNKSVNSMYTDLDRNSEKRTNELELTKQDPFSVLLLGVDERDGDSGRSDSMIVLTVNPELKSVKMLSIPRDTRTEIVGHNTTDKINHAYAFGGTNMSMDTVEHFLDIPIDYFLEINMDGFKDIVDAVGGITVQNNLDFTYGNVHFAKGTIKLNGEEALKYSQMRYEDPNGDFGRQERQRQIIQAVIKEGANISSLANYGDILDALSKNIKTNLAFDNMIDIQKNYREASTNVEQMTIKGQGTKMDGIYYYIVSEEEQQKAQTQLKEHLAIK
ncbi:LytR family transcriptional regulator [Bacillus sp. JJ634]